MASGLGAGWSNLHAGLRLRYEIHRKFAPYIGVTWGKIFVIQQNLRVLIGQKLIATLGYWGFEHGFN